MPAFRHRSRGIHRVDTPELPQRRVERLLRPLGIAPVDQADGQAPLAGQPGESGEQRTLADPAGPVDKDDATGSIGTQRPLQDLQLSHPADEWRMVHRRRIARRGRLGPWGFAGPSA